MELRDNEFLEVWFFDKNECLLCCDTANSLQEVKELVELKKVNDTRYSWHKTFLFGGV